MEIHDLPADKKIILFDGVCNLCNGFVQVVIKYDSNDIFRFVALQSDLGMKIISHTGISNQNIDSVVLFEFGIAYYYKSNAVLKIAKDLSGFFCLVTFFKFLPTIFRNCIYDYIAKNRYLWFGKQENCLLPSSELKSKFLS